MKKKEENWPNISASYISHRLPWFLNIGQRKTHIGRPLILVPWQFASCILYTVPRVHVKSKVYFGLKWTWISGYITLVSYLHIILKGTVHLKNWNLVIIYSVTKLCHVPYWTQKMKCLSLEHQNWIPFFKISCFVFHKNSYRFGMKWG